MRTALTFCCSHQTNTACIFCILWSMCVMTTDLSQVSTSSDFLDVPFGSSVFNSLFHFCSCVSTTRLSFVGMNTIMIGKALGLWNFIYSKTVKTVPDTVLVQGICHFPSVITIFLSHKSGRDYVNSQVNTPAESQSLVVMVWMPSVCAVGLSAL